MVKKVKSSRDILTNSIIHNGIIAKITASTVIILVSLELLNHFNCLDTANVILPVLTGVLCTAMTFLFTKKDGKLG